MLLTLPVSLASLLDVTNDYDGMDVVEWPFARIGMRGVYVGDSFWPAKVSIISLWAMSECE